MRTVPDNDDDYVDSRDVIKRIDDLEGEVGDDVAQDYYALSDEGWKALPETDRKLLIEKHAEVEHLSNELEELVKLKALEEACDSSEWKHGVTLIRYDYFETYAQETAEEIGAIAKDASWPAMYIDWERAADALKMDYTVVEWDGVTYYYR